ncbi:MAG: hypothetical protein K8S20_13675 [Chloroflexi bacterium]|nr:hypothetical protein [Chloroflexota bacterium]
MKPDSQFVRWGIPGWTLAISFIIFALFDNNSKIIVNTANLFATQGNGDNFWALLFAGVLTIGAGIPVGYLIYQIYFYLRWVSPVSKNGFWPPAIHGRMEEMNDSLREIKKLTLGFGEPWREGVIKDTSDHRTFWHYINPLLHEALVKIDRNDVYYRHLGYLKETLHSLGASHLGFLFGYLIYLDMKLASKELTAGDIAIILVCTVSNYFLITRGEQNRRKQKVEKRHFFDAQAELFTSMLIFVYATLNPNINQTYSPFITGAILLGLVVMWIRSVGSNDKDGTQPQDAGENEERAMIGVAFFYLALVVWCLYVSNEYGIMSKMVNWSTIFGVIIYNSITIAFLKIKQNTVDSLTMVQYYLIKLLANEKR